MMLTQILVAFLPLLIQNISVRLRKEQSPVRPWCCIFVLFPQLFLRKREVIFFLTFEVGKFGDGSFIEQRGNPSGGSLNSSFFLLCLFLVHVWAGGPQWYQILGAFEINGKHWNVLNRLNRACYLWLCKARGNLSFIMNHAKLHHNAALEAISNCTVLLCSPFLI